MRNEPKGRSEGQATGPVSHDESLLSIFRQGNMRRSDFCFKNILPAATLSIDWRGTKWTLVD